MEQQLLGLIGIGLLGGAMAERLLSRGFRALGLDVVRARCDALRGLGGEVATSARQVIQSCDRILFSLPTGGVAAELVDQIEAFLRPGQTILDTTTGEPQGAEALGRGLAGLGVSYLDATVSGSSQQARCGDVAILAGGDPRAFEACRDVF